MAKGGRILSECLHLLEEAAQPGVTTKTLDRGAEEFLLGRGATPAFKGYKGYPFAICASLNGTVAHGLPSNRVLRSGDVLSVDLGVEYEGWITDAALTFPIGDASAEAERLIEATNRALLSGTLQAIPGSRIGDISAAIQAVAQEQRLTVVQDFIGHGIGRSLHEDPDVPNVGKKGTGEVLEEGAVIAIEPMFTLGAGRTKLDLDGWALHTRDDCLAAHAEFTVAITSNGPRVLTPWLVERT